jgi:Tfp pilus assembly protein FimT
MIEVMLVLSMLGIIASVSLGKLHEIIVQQRVLRAASAVQNTVETAFAIATRNRRPISISWDASTMQLKVTDAAGTTRFRSLSLGSDAYSLPSGSVTLTENPIAVYPNGLAADSFSVKLTTPKTSKRVWISRAGLVKLCSSNDTGCLAP